jgi:staphylococcal nuclease domain-containing protein 1
MAPSFIANVKSVLSGDTLVLASPNNPAAERTLSLAFVSAPRLSKDGDEPFAFQSREFLRNLVVGKQVKFSVSCEYAMESSTAPSVTPLQ